MAKKKISQSKSKSGALTTPDTKLNIKEYVQVLAGLKKQIQEAQIKATLAANKELIKLYWSMGKTISEKQEKSGWGSGIIQRLATDLQKEFPGLGGFSRPNIFRMKAFFAAYSIVSQSARQLDELPIFNIPWFHNIILLHKVKNYEERLWYAQKTIENGWSRSVLEMQIESHLYNRKGKAITNFKATFYYAYEIVSPSVTQLEDMPEIIWGGDAT